MDPSWKYLSPFFSASPMSHLHTWCPDVPFQPGSSKLIMDSLIHSRIEIKIRLRFTEGNAMRGGRKRGRCGGGVAGLGTDRILLRHSCAREWLPLGASYKLTSDQTTLLYQYWTEKMIILDQPFGWAMTIWNSWGVYIYIIYTKYIINVHNICNIFLFLLL